MTLNLIRRQEDGRMGIKIMASIENVNNFENEIKAGIGDPGHIMVDGRVHRFDTDRRGEFL